MLVIRKENLWNGATWFDSNVLVNSVLGVNKEDCESHVSQILSNAASIYNRRAAANICFQISGFLRIEGFGEFDFFGKLRLVHVLPPNRTNMNIDHNGSEYVYLKNEFCCEPDELHKHTHYIAYDLRATDNSFGYEVAFGVHHTPADAVADLWQKTAAFVENLIQDARKQLSAAEATKSTDEAFEESDSYKLVLDYFITQGITDSVKKKARASGLNSNGKTPTNYNAVMWTPTCKADDLECLSSEELLRISNDLKHYRILRETLEKLETLERKVADLERELNK